VEHRFDSKVAIVTGSSSGIGKAIALRLAQQGAAICVVADRNTQGGQATAEEIRRNGGKSAFVQADVSVQADCERITAEALDAFGRIDILVNNAGITRTTPLDRLSEELWDQVLDTNLKSAYLMARQVVPHMLARGWGSIVNIGSVHATRTMPGMAAYAASKAGLCGLTRALACELGSRGIRVNCVLPGTIDISLHNRANRPVDPATWTPRANNAQVMQRNGSPTEVAAAVSFLASDEASFTNGATVTVDGGLTNLLRDR